MSKCFNIDWLELFCYEDRNVFPCDANFFESKGWNVKQREFGTRVYGEMFTLFDTQGFPFLEIRRKPLSDVAKDGGLFDEKACHIRLTNYYCYVPQCIDILREFLLRYSYNVVRIFRVDVCCDFTQFDKGDDPAKFIQRYMNGRYSKINQANISAHGVDRWDGRLWNSLSWGKPKSMVSTKFYCKSLELQQVKDKPYIRNAWFNAGLIDNPFTGEKRQADGTITTPPIWRVEFSIKSSAKKWYVIERADTRKERLMPMPNTLDVYDTTTKLQCVFASLANHYFHFKKYEDGKRKDRCKDKILFDFSNLTQTIELDKRTTSEPANKNIYRLIARLEQMQEKTIEKDVRKAIAVIIDYLKKQQVIEFLPTDTTINDILALQQLIARRLKGNNDITLANVRQAIENLSEPIF